MGFSWFFFTKILRSGVAWILNTLKQWVVLKMHFWLYHPFLQQHLIFSHNQHDVFHNDIQLFLLRCVVLRHLLPIYEETVRSSWQLQKSYGSSFNLNAIFLCLSAGQAQDWKYFSFFSVYRLKETSNDATTFRCTHLSISKTQL